MATRTISRSPLNLTSEWLKQYLALKNEVKQISKRADEIKRSLLTVVENDHIIDEDKGHLIYTLDEPVELLDGTYTGFMKQRKVSQVFLEDVAEELFDELGFDIDDYTSRYIDQEKVTRLYAEDKITEEQFKTLFENNVSYAFVPVKE